MLHEPTTIPIGCPRTHGGPLITEAIEAGLVIPHQKKSPEHRRLLVKIRRSSPRQRW